MSKQIRFTDEEWILLELVVDDWLHENEDTNVDYRDVERIHEKIKVKYEESKQKLYGEQKCTCKII